MTNGNGLDDLREALVDLAAYPIMTEEVPYPAAPSSTSSPASGGRDGGQLGAVVGNALRDVLGWRPNNKDPKGFSAALKQAFDLKDVEGHVESSWRQRSYAIQADMGAITGAQASIYSRAKVALDQSLPLLEGLYTLNVASDPQDMESIRSIISSELKDLVAELGVEGGPRVQRVDGFFRQLLGTQAATGSSAAVGGQLLLLGQRFGLDSSRINTIEEEQNFTNYLILIDYIKGLSDSWHSNRHFFDNSGSDVFLGTQLVQLSRFLSVITESVDEAIYAMDSVFLGPAERQITSLTFGGHSIQLELIPRAVNGPKYTQYAFPGNTPVLYLADLLDWVKRVASSEGPRFIQDAGKDGVGALLPVLDNLRKLVRGALTTQHKGAQVATSFPPSYGSPRVQRALKDLADQLDDATRLASPIKRVAGVTVSSVLPLSLLSIPASGNSKVRVDPTLQVIEGSGFQQGATVKMLAANHDINASQVVFQGSGLLIALFDQSKVEQAISPPKGTQWTIRVTNADGTTGELTEAFIFPS